MPTSPRCSRRPAADMARFRVGVDIGGTFTDIVFLDDDGNVHTKKVSSSVDDYARAIVESIRELFHETGVAGHDVSEACNAPRVPRTRSSSSRAVRPGSLPRKASVTCLRIALSASRGPTASAG